MAFSSDGASLLKVTFCRLHTSERSLTLILPLLQCTSHQFSKSARAAVSSKMDTAKASLSAAPNGHVSIEEEKKSPISVQAKTDLDMAKLAEEAAATPKLEQPQQHFSMPNQTAPKPLGHFHEFSPKITVIGVGGAGGNAVSNMIARDLQGVDFMVCNTDAQHLSTCLTDHCVQLGRATTQGLGCGANPDAGKMAALESREEIMEHIEGSHMVFITAGMGGGTGTGAAPVIAETCLDAGILTVAVVTQPFRFEGKHRARLALEGLETMEKVTDTLIVIPNQNIFQLVDQSTSLADSFRLADDVLLAGVRSVTDLMVTPGLINLDFADVQSVMKGMGTAMMGSGQAEGEVSKQQLTQYARRYMHGASCVFFAPQIRNATAEHLPFFLS